MRDEPTVIAVCRGLSCDEYRSAEVLKDYESALGIRAGQATPEGGFSLRIQHCFGRCATGPNVEIGERFFSRQEPGMAAQALSNWRG